MSDRPVSIPHFALLDFQTKRAFSSFLPGIAGLNGIPMWVFYVNRGQGIAGFGVESKDHPLMEFQAAQRAYQVAAQVGFRTFLKGSRGSTEWTYEPFGEMGKHNSRRTMITGLNELLIEEINDSLGLKTSIQYFLLPNEPFAALVRQVTFTNIGNGSLHLDILDGLPVLCPYGIDDQTFKNMGRTIEAWMEVVNHETGLPFFRIKASADDKLHVEEIQAGNFALAVNNGKLLSAIVDPQAVWGMDTAFGFPRELAGGGLTAVVGKTQVTHGRTPCAVFGTELELPAGGSETINSFYGHAARLDLIKAQIPRLIDPEFVAGKFAEQRKLALEITKPIQTGSGSETFNDYCSQTWLDNVMRGGMPLQLGGKHTYHVYSRRHGDLERDYNFFVVAPEFYSQGNGNYRDVNQNRRSDVFFFPGSGEFNIRLFMSLIQSDGYNPLTIQGTCFTIPKDSLSCLVKLAAKPEDLEKLLNGPFTPGQLMNAAQQAELSVTLEDFLEKVFSISEQHIQAVHGEGYWSDHWSYNLDLVESFLAIYPEQREYLFFDSDPLPFYDNAVCINPRSQRFVLDGEQPRHFNVLTRDLEKAEMLAGRVEESAWSRTNHGKGEVFKLPLVSKFTLLAMLKFAALDPSGFGVQMEGGKPGWYDALNGLPALFGSSMPDSYELLRLLDFLINLFTETNRPVKLPLEAVELTRAIQKTLGIKSSTFDVWEKLSTALEVYRSSTRLGFGGKCEELNLLDVLQLMRAYLADGVARAEAVSGEIPTTYFMHQVKKYEKTGEFDPEGRPCIRLLEFEPKPLPQFLEGPVRRMHTLDAGDVIKLYWKLKKSTLYDQKLRMFRLNASLEDMPHMIGRARAFTPGWLENESIWMHMAFKLMLELLRKGLYEEFFEEFKIHCPAFMDPEVYGRSPLENSSFIASSAHPDPTLHGNGFVARLSGSTAEFISMWVLMTAGHQPFTMEKGELELTMKPILPGWLFKDDGTFSFKLLGACDVSLHNPTRMDIYQVTPKSIILFPVGGGEVVIKGNVIRSPYANMVREGKIAGMQVYY